MINSGISQTVATIFKGVDHQLFMAATIIIFLSACKSKPMIVENIEFENNAKAIVQLIEEPVIPKNIIDLNQFAKKQADENGTYDFYPDIKSAIDSLKAIGGGTLLFTHSKGLITWAKRFETYRCSGPIILYSNIELRFQPCVKLLFEFAPSNYLPENKPVLRRYEGTFVYSFCPLIYAFNANNISIAKEFGNGANPVIEGNGEKWQKWEEEGNSRVQMEGRIPAYQSIRADLNEKDIPLGQRICADLDYHFLRPAMMEFVHCEKVKIDGIKIKDSPFWVIHPVFTNQMIVRNTSFDCQNVNNDGIDIESSSNVLVENVVFDNHDDNIVIKSGRDREGRQGALVEGSEFENINSPYVNKGRINAPTINVVVRNCVFQGHYAFCVGSEISGGAHDIYVSDCFSPTEVFMGVFIKSNRKRGGIVENIFVKNLVFNKVRNDLVCIIPNYDGDTTSNYPTTIRKIEIENISASESGRGLRIYGWPDAPIKQVMIDQLVVGSITDNIQEYEFLINQVDDVQLYQVNIAGSNYDGVYNKRDSIHFPPAQN